MKKIVTTQWITFHDIFLNFVIDFFIINKKNFSINYNNFFNVDNDENVCQ